MQYRSIAVVLACAGLVLGTSFPARAQVSNETPRELAGIGIDDKRGAQLPLDVMLRDQDGNEVKLASAFDGERPVLLVLAYYQCPMLCTLVLNQLKTGISGLAYTAGKEYRVVTVSIDPRDKPADAKAKRAKYIESYGRDVGAHGWDFFVGDEREVKRLADAIGFHYRWDEQTQQFAHAAGVFVTTPAGRLSQTLYGLQYEPSTLRLALTEATAGKLGSALDRVLLFCYHYDASKQGYVVARARLAMTLGSLASLLGFAIWLVSLWRAEMTRPPHRQEAHPS